MLGTWNKEELTKQKKKKNCGSSETMKTALSKHFKGGELEDSIKLKEKIIYIRQGKTMAASRIHPVFDKSGLGQKFNEISKIRHLPENLMYFATCVDISGHALFEINKAVDPYGYKDMCGIHKLHKKEKIKSPIFIDSDTVTVMCKYAGFAEVGDMVYIKLNFIRDYKFPSISVIQEHTVFSRSSTITTNSIAELRGSLDLDSDSDSDSDRIMKKKRGISFFAPQQNSHDFCLTMG